MLVELLLLSIQMVRVNKLFDFMELEVIHPSDNCSRFGPLAHNGREGRGKEIITNLNILYGWTYILKHNDRFRISGNQVLL